MLQNLKGIAPILLGICAGIAPALPAQESLPELDRLRMIYFEQRDKATRPVALNYGKALVAHQEALLKDQKIEEAIEVKEEITRLKNELAGSTQPTKTAPIAQTEPAPEMSNAAPDLDLRWRGDFKENTIDGETVLTIEANESGERMIYVELKDVQDAFDNRLTWRFDYRSEDYQGEGFDIRFDFVDLQRISRVGTAIRPNGNWIERTLPFADLKGEERVNFQIVVKPGKGEVHLKDIELLNR